MGAFAGARTPMMVVAVVVALGVLVPATSGQRASPGNRALAAQLLARDPGARVGGNSQVATATRVRVLGVPRRMNFILGLGPREWIVGGARDDQLGARGDANRVYGAAGNDLIHGGPGAQMLYGGPGIDALYGGRGDDRLDGGPGNDRIIDAQGATTVRTGTGRDRVDVGDGHPDDRVLCAPGSIKRIHADGDDRIEASCRRSAAARIIYRWPATAPPAHAAQTVSGDGSNERPYTAPCDDPDSGLCTVSAFASRTFTHLWALSTCPPTNVPQISPTCWTKAIRSQRCRTASRSKGSVRSESRSRVSAPANRTSAVRPSTSGWGQRPAFLTPAPLAGASDPCRTR